MGIKYYKPEEIKDHHSEIKTTLSKEKPNYFVRTGQVSGFIKKHVGKESKILEVGCGYGFLTMQLQKNDFRNITLIDIDDYRSEKIKSLPFDVLDVCFDKFPYEDNAFDVITATAILEHLENPYFFLRESIRVLKPHGLLIISFPNIFSLRAKKMFLFSNNLKGYSVTNNHITLFTKDVFNKVFLSNLRIKKISYSEGYIKLLRKKLKINLNKHFGDKVLYVLEKKERGAVKKKVIS